MLERKWPLCGYGRVYCVPLWDVFEFLTHVSDSYVPLVLICPECIHDMLSALMWQLEITEAQLFLLGLLLLHIEFASIKCRF